MFFFFRQKTAYELRISDWSSDVCSSDLGVAEVLAGKDSGWESQRRDDGSLPFSSLLRSYGGLTFLGVLAALMSWSISPALAAWMSPVILGLFLSLPLVVLTAMRPAGQSVRRGPICRTT